MNDGAYPRLQRRDGFDLMAQEFRRGDRSRREDDRYLFLESLLSARRCLYLSYVGRHIREDTVIPPSVLVSELIDYLAREDPTVGERLVTQHPLQAFSRRYFTGDAALFTYSEAAAHAASVAGSGSREPVPFLPAALPAADMESRLVDLDTFVRFFRNPVRHLFEHRLKIRLATADEEIVTSEPFRADGLVLFDLKQRLLDLTLRNAPHDGLTLARAGGDLPHGALGAALYECEAERVSRVARSIGSVSPPSAAASVRFELTAGEATLSGALTNAGAEGMTDYRMSRTNEHLRIRAWIRHLVLNAFAPSDIGRTSRCVTQQSVLTFLPVADARERLSELLELYWRGLHRPLHFFPRTSWAYVEAGDDEIAGRVRAVWEGSRWEESEARAECEDPYYQLAFRGIDPLDDEFKALARALFTPMRAAMREEALP
jgi:exodeoxyribonuclease V gamma subunit